MSSNDEYDPILTMAALNMALVSLHKIISTKNRFVLNQEYINIINNLRIGDIEADPELINLFQEIVKVINKGRLKEEEFQSIERSYRNNKKKSIQEIIVSNMGTAFHATIFGWLGKLAAFSLSEYFSNVSKYAKIENEKLDLLLNIKKQEFEEYDLLQRNLLASSWKLWRKYSLPEYYRLTQDSLDFFYKATQEPNPSIRLSMLEDIQKYFQMYSPYWFYRADSAIKANNPAEAGKSIAKFDEVWRPVLRKDPYKVEILKYKIDRLLNEQSNSENINLLRDYLSGFRENLQLNDWANNIYAGMTYYAINQSEDAIKSIRPNVNFKIEIELSKNILISIENKVPLDELLELSKNIDAQDIQGQDSDSSSDSTHTPENQEPQKSQSKIISTVRESLSKIAALPPKTKIFAAIISGVIILTGLILAKSAVNNKSNNINNVITQEQEIKLAAAIKSDDLLPANINPRVQAIMEKAIQGDLKSQFTLGDMYLNGNAVKRNIQEAIKWHKKAADQGYAPSQFKMGLIYTGFSGIKADKQETLKWYTMAANNGNSMAQYNLGEMYRSGKWVKRDIIEAIKWYKMAADQKEEISQFAQYALGEMYRKGDGVERNINEAIKWYKLAADNDNYLAQYELGIIYRDGDGVSKNLDEAKKWLKKAEYNGSEKAKQALYQIENSRNLKENSENPSNQLKYYIAKTENNPLSPALQEIMTKAAQGDVYSQSQLANMYLKGNGIERNIDEAIKWYKSAANNGDSGSQFMLGLIYTGYGGVKANKQESLKWYSMAANNGYYQAQQKLGDIYRTGDGVKRDIIETIKWYKLAADQGDQFSQYRLGEMYRKGDGVERNIDEAIKWYKMASDKGHFSAQYELGIIYLDGDGVTKNLDEARKWLKKAEYNGSKKAKEALYQLDNPTEK